MQPPRGWGQRVDCPLRLRAASERNHPGRRQRGGGERSGFRVAGSCDAHGTLTVTVDGASGRATGEVGGPLGPANVEGLVADGKLTAAVRRKDPTDRGFTGTLAGAITGDKVDGTMSMSLGQASSLRSATFSLAPEASR
jgi:hypothetical protein